MLEHHLLTSLLNKKRAKSSKQQATTESLNGRVTASRELQMTKGQGCGALRKALDGQNVLGYCATENCYLQKA